jgi:hypothetical protein
LTPLFKTGASNLYKTRYQLNDILSDVEIIEAELTLKEGGQSKNADGRIDILASYAQEYIAVVELKLGTLEEAHLNQLECYLEKKDNLLKKYSALIGENLSANPKWLGILVGSSINSRLGEKIKSGYKILNEIQVAALTMQRYWGSDGQIYVTTETFFNNRVSSCDRTQYLFNNTKF